MKYKRANYLNKLLKQRHNIALLFVIFYLADLIVQVNVPSTIRLVSLFLSTCQVGEILLRMIFWGRNKCFYDSGLKFVLGYVVVSMTWFYIQNEALLSFLIIALCTLKFVQILSRRSIRSNKVRIGMSFARTEINSALILFILSAWTWQRWTPINPQGFWKYQTDTFYIESLSNSFFINQTRHSLLSNYDHLNYHWLSYSYVGLLTHFSNLPNFYAVHWIMPIVILLLLRSAISMLYRNVKFHRVQDISLATLLIVIGPGFEIPSWIPFSAISTSLSIPICLYLIFFVTESISETVPKFQSLMIVALLIFGLTGTKGSTGIVITLSFLLLIIIATLYYLVTNKRLINLKLAVLPLLTLLVTFSFAYFFFFGGETRRFPLRFGLSLNSLSLIGICLVLFLSVSRLDLRHIYSGISYCLVIIGSLFAIFSIDSSGNEIWFLYASYPIALILSLDKHRHSNCIKDEVLIRANLRNMLIALSMTIMWKYAENMTGNMGRAARTLIEMFVPVVVLILINFAYLSKKKLEIWSKFRFEISKIIILNAAFTLLINTVAGPIYSKSTSIYSYGSTTNVGLGAISKHELETGRWINANLPIKAIFITNRLCLSNIEQPPACDDTWAAGSAFAKRNFLLDGTGYVSKTYGKSHHQNEDEVLIQNFFSSPNKNIVAKLQEVGVHFIWLDKRSYWNPKIREFSRTLFSSGYLEVLRI